MNVITNILYWLSSGMLIPVIIALLMAFGWSLLLIGDLYGHFAQRMRSKHYLRRLFEWVKNEPVRTIIPENMLLPNTPIGTYINHFRNVEWHPVHCEKILTDYELHMKKGLEGPMILMRVGPMLGLMGTLIPMGPALVGLAAGDIQSMALNMRVAFSTTVVGLFTGAIGFIVQLYRQRWYRYDGEILQYLFALSQEQETSA